MLLRAIFKNFLSFNDEVQFDMFANEKRETLSDHIYHPSFDVPLLKQAAIYGANGAGKSNFVKGLEFVREFVRNEDFLTSLLVKQYLFRLKNGVGQDPIEIVLEFSNKDEKVFLYEIAISTDKVVKEKLSISGLGQTKHRPIFDRDGDVVKFHKTPVQDVKEVIDGWLKEHPLSSLLTLNNRLPVIKDEDFKKVICWFDQELAVIAIQSLMDGQILYYRNNVQFQRFAKQVLHEIGLGIQSIDINTIPFENWQKDHQDNIISKEDLPQKDGQVLNLGFNDRMVVSVTMENGEIKASEMRFHQRGLDNFVGDMDIMSQSDGTNKLLRILPAIYRAMEEGSTVVVDEIENSIHPHLIKALVRYYAEHPSNGQLIFTTHETCLMNQAFMRPDEVWLAEKKNGVTELYSLNEFKLHNTLNLEKGYLEGRYGGIPFIGNLDELPQE